jgi:nucleoside-diphosphate-sugar epimerase
MRVLVTGSTGFVGRAVVDHLVQAGETVVAVSRRTVPDAKRPGVVQSAAEVTDRLAVRQAVSGCGVVVHLAGLAHTRGAADQEYRRVNVDGTRIVAEESAHAGARRLVLVSTASVHGRFSERPVSEEADPQPPDAYARSKLEAEAAAGAVAQASGMQLVILRPPLICGPGAKANLLALVKALARGWPVPVSRANRRSLLSLRNAAEAVAFAAGPNGPEGTFLLSDGVDVTTYDMARSLCAGLGRGGRLVVVPRAVIRASRWINPYVADRLFGSFFVNPSRFLDTGWTPTATVWDGLEETGRWYRTAIAGS